MSTTINKQKQIVALSELQHVRKRSTMYVGSVDISDEKLILIQDNLLKNSWKKISVGFYKLFNEILDNAFDAIKRDKISNGKIKIIIDSTNNKVQISDNAHGFFEAEKINESSGLTNVETAITMLRAGSNFYNEDVDDNLIGTNGVGSALVNMLSDEFSIHTINNEISYFQKWNNFETIEKEIQKKTSIEKSGTLVSFIPYKELFKNNKWDLEILQSQLCYRNYLKKFDSLIQDTEIEFYFDEIKINLNLDFLPKDIFELQTPIGNLIIYPSFKDSANISFVNSLQCTGIHQKIIQDYLNENIFKVSNAHNFYETFFILNLPPKHVRFGDQNKTKYVVGRSEIEPIIMRNFEKKIKKDFLGSNIYDIIFQNIEESTKASELKKINQKKKEARKKVSDKYFPSSKKKEILFLAEGASAAGGLCQKRNAEFEAVYALRGKIKNTKRLSDLSNNNEIIDLITLLGIDLEKKSGCDFEKIIIATDADADGSHISSLLINFFYKWFPHIITENRLYLLSTPLMSGEINGKVKYIYSLNDQSELEGARNIRYLKGLGSLNIKDWEKIMKEKRVYQIKEDGRADKILKVAFGDSSDSRKKWLSN